MRTEAPYGWILTFRCEYSSVRTVPAAQRTRNGYQHAASWPLQRCSEVGGRTPPQGSGPASLAAGGLGCLTCVVRLDRQDAGCDAEVLLAGDQRGGTLRSKHSTPMSVHKSIPSRTSCRTCS